MTKNLKIILSVLALISIGISVGIFFGWDFFAGKLKQAGINSTNETAVEKTGAPTPTPEFEIKSIVGALPENTKFKLPVEKKYLENAFPAEKEVYLTFNLEPGAEIKPIFPGEVLTSVLRPERDMSAGKDPESNIIWVKNENGLKAEYFFLGENLVKEGDAVSDNTVLGRAKEGKLASRKGANFSLMVVNEKGEMIELSKDLFFKD